MLLGVIADDFTGASDIANTIAKGTPETGGLRVAQFMGVPSGPAPAGVEAGVVSLKSRSTPATDAVECSLAALDWLKAQGCIQFVFKYCSTFDSTPEGNIGPVGEALARALGVRGVGVCPSFPAMGRTVYQGHLFVHDRLLNESGLENHPLTPMTDANIRRWLARQTQTPVGLVPLSTLHRGADAVRAALATAAGRGETLVIVDAASDEDLLTIAVALAGAVLVTGGSGIAAGLAANFLRRGDATGERSGIQGVDGPGAILSGSCSSTTRAQIAWHAKDHPALPIDIEAVMDGKADVMGFMRFFSENEGKAPLVYSSSDPAEVAAVQNRYGREMVAARLDRLFADLARALVESGVRRLVVAGGETSGAVAQALDLGALEIGAEIDPGVPVLANADRSVALALKSGNFGTEDFFVKALDVMAGRR